MELVVFFGFFLEILEGMVLIEFFVGVVVGVVIFVEYDVVLVIFGVVIFGFVDVFG